MAIRITSYNVCYTKLLRKLGIDSKKEQVRGSVVLPHGVGKSKRIAVVTSTKNKEAEEAGADLIGGEELVTKIKTGKTLNFDVLVASPEMMRNNFV